MNNKTLLTLLTMVTLLTPTLRIGASEISHYTPGILNIRDFIVPDPGFYFVLYNYGYTTDRLNDRNGNQIKSITINPGPGPGVTLNLDVDVDSYAVAPTFIWVSDWKILGARYGAYIAPSFANTTVSAALSTETESGRGVDESFFGVGDLFVQPVWLGWSLTNWDFSLGYGFYAPVGKYNTDTVTYPVIGPVTVPANDNIGLGFWTQQIQGALAWYPWAHKATAVTAGLTYEINSKKEDFDITPGQNLTLNWGISQYLPLKKDGALLLEIGPAGYDSWQITDDTGSDARNPGVHDEVHAVGGQLGLTYAPWNAVLNFHYFYEFAAVDRFQGQSIGLSFAIKF